MIVIVLLALAVYLVFLYQLQIIEGEEYYSRDDAVSTDRKRVV